MLETVRRLGAPVMVSASALARWTDDGPVPEGHEFTAFEASIRRRTGDSSPPTAAQRRRRVRTWSGWNTGALDRLGKGIEVHLDSAGFVAMVLHRGYPWTPESYIDDLCTHQAVTRFSAMDFCCENEIAPDRIEVRERISRTIGLNLRCASLARDAGVAHKLMPVIQGVTADDYVRCFDAISGAVAHGATVGVGSMCRRPTTGPDGSTAILERLDRDLPADVRLHLFGLKSRGAEEACAFGDRINSVDSQAYGVRARRIANDRRGQDPSFSKSVAFVASVMEQWYLGQVARMEAPRLRPAQPELLLPESGERPATVLDAVEIAERERFNRLVEERQLDHDQIVGGRMLEESVLGWLADLPDGVGPMDRWKGNKQLPEEMVEAEWFPHDLLAAA